MDLLDQGDSLAGISYDVTEKDREECLKISTKKGLCKLMQKIQLLIGTLKLKKELLDLAQDSDSEEPTNLRDKLQSMFNKELKSPNAIKTAGNDATEIICKGEGGEEAGQGDM